MRVARIVSILRKNTPAMGLDPGSTYLQCTYGFGPGLQENKETRKGTFWKLRGSLWHV